jgi:hypothetical protein
LSEGISKPPGLRIGPRVRNRALREAQAVLKLVHFFAIIAFESVEFMEILDIIYLL